MTGDAVERYRACDPLLREAPDEAIVDPPLRRRLGHLGPASCDDERRSVGRRQWTVGVGRVPLAMAALVFVASLALCVFTLTGEGRRAPPGARGQVAGDRSGAVAGTTLDNRAHRLSVLVVDGFASQFAAAVNDGTVHPALKLLSPESDCDVRVRSDGLHETCERFWAHQVELGTKILFGECHGSDPRTCILSITSEPAAPTGHPDHVRRGAVEFGLDQDDRLVFRWSSYPATVYHCPMGTTGGCPRAL